MLGSYRVYDADAHVILAPAMWEDLPEKYVPRRPRPATFSDSGDMAAYASGWLIDGRVEPHILGLGLQPTNTPAWVVEGRHRDTNKSRAILRRAVVAPKFVFCTFQLPSSLPRGERFKSTREFVCPRWSD